MQSGQVVSRTINKTSWSLVTSNRSTTRQTVAIVVTRKSVNLITTRTRTHLQPDIDTLQGGPKCNTPCFCNNFIKYCRIFKILSPTQTTVNSHHATNALSCGLVKENYFFGDFATFGWFLGHVYRACTETAICEFAVKILTTLVDSAILSSCFSNKCPNAHLHSTGHARFLALGLIL